MKFMIKTTSVANRLSVGVSSPQCGCVCPAIGAARALTFGRGLKMKLGSLKHSNNLGSISTHQPSLRLHKGPIGSIHFIIETTSIAEIVTIAIPSPEWCRGRTAVHTLATLCNETKVKVEN